MHIQKEKRRKSWSKQKKKYASLFSKKNVEKPKQKKKGIILKVKIYNIDLHMQMNTDSEVTLI